MNSCVLVGRLGADPRIHQFDDGKSVAHFSIAIDRAFKKEGETITDWFQCEAWGKTADVVAKYVHKGDAVGIIGSIEFNERKDMPDKPKQAVVKVREVSLMPRTEKKDNAWELGEE